MIFGERKVGFRKLGRGWLWGYRIWLLIKMGSGERFRWGLFYFTNVYIYIYIMNAYYNFPKRLSKTWSLCLFFL